MEWSPQQDAALHSVRRWLENPGSKKIFRLFGYAGSGKTTLAIEIAGMVKGRCLFASFTGKASLVMRRKGCDGARTLHSLIYKIRTDLEEGEERNDEKPLFELNPDSDLCYADLLIIDECSMVNEELGRDVMSFDVPVLVLGDPAQLPPVSGGGYFTEHEPDVMLTEIHRQAEGNPIIHVATDVRLGRGLKYGSMVGDGGLVGVSIVKRQQLMRGSMLRADQILCGRNDTRNSLNRKMRALLREKRTLPLGPAGLEDRPVVGDRVICLKNKRDRGIFNGGIFRVKELLDRKPEAKRPGRVDVSYMMLDSEDDERKDIPAFVPNAFWHWNAKEADLKLPDELSRRKWDEFDYAYAITCHKSQGSQWDKVVVIDESSVFSRGPNGDEMARRWLYTACSRAAEKLIIAR